MSTGWFTGEAEIWTVLSTHSIAGVAALQLERTLLSAELDLPGLTGKGAWQMRTLSGTNFARDMKS